MKILVITDLYPIELNEKKTPKTIYDFVQGWKNFGHEVFVLKPNFLLNSFLRNKPFYKSGIYDDIENVNFLTPFWGNIGKKIMAYSLNFEPEIVIAHMPCGLITANKLINSNYIPLPHRSMDNNDIKLSSNLPLITGVHVSDLDVLTNPIYSIYFKSEMEKAYKNASKIACRSEVLRKKFLALYPEYEGKTFVAFSGIDEKIITQKQWQKKERYKILTCANLIKRKNVDKLILACEKFENIDLTIIGDGKELNKLKKLSSKPIFKGHLPHNQTLEEMRNSDIFILPSVNETFGMVYLEAMASGCITVGIKNDGIDGIIKNEVNGYLTLPDIKNISETIENIISTDNSEILEKTYQTIQNYTQEKACLNYLNNI